jgi:hypothetical protein
LLLQGERVEMMDDDASLVGGGGAAHKSATSLPNPARSFAGASVAGWITFLCRCGCARARERNVFLFLELIMVVLFRIFMSPWMCACVWKN